MSFFERGIMETINQKLRKLREVANLGGGVGRREAQHKNGKLTARER